MSIFKAGRAYDSTYNIKYVLLLLSLTIRHILSCYVWRSAIFLIKIINIYNPAYVRYQRFEGSLNDVNWVFPCILARRLLDYSRSCAINTDWYQQLINCFCLSEKWRVLRLVRSTYCWVEHYSESYVHECSIVNEDLSLPNKCKI